MRPGGGRQPLNPAIIPSNIHSLTDFKQWTPKLVAQMEESRHPLVLTVNGRPQLVVLPAASYEWFQQALERMEAIEAIQRGLESFDRGAGRPAREAFEELRRKHEIPH